jgi:hypothetical protein
MSDEFELEAKIMRMAELGKASEKEAGISKINYINRSIFFFNKSDFGSFNIKNSTKMLLLAFFASTADFRRHYNGRRRGRRQTPAAEAAPPQTTAILTPSVGGEPPDTAVLSPWAFASEVSRGTFLDGMILSPYAFFTQLLAFDTLSLNALSPYAFVGTILSAEVTVEFRKFIFKNSKSKIYKMMNDKSNPKTD